MTAWICGGSVDTLPVGGGLTGLPAGSEAGGYWQLEARSGGGAKAGSGGAAITGPVDDEVVPDPARPGTLTWAGVLDAGLLPESSFCTTRAMTKATTAASARANAPTMPNSRRRDCVGL